MNTREAIANRIRQLCSERGITPNGLSNISAVPQATVKSRRQALQRVGAADKILDYADRPSFCLYSSGLSPPREILIRFSRYQTI